MRAQYLSIIDKKRVPACRELTFTDGAINVIMRTEWEVLLLLRRRLLLQGV